MTKTLEVFIDKFANIMNVTKGMLSPGCFYISVDKGLQQVHVMNMGSAIFDQFHSQQEKPPSSWQYKVWRCHACV